MSNQQTASTRLNDPSVIRRDFPFFQGEGKNLHYLDNAATSQKPQKVLEALLYSYSKANANVHRGVYAVSEESTASFEQARQKTAEFLGGVKASEIFFTSGATLGINVLAQSLGEHLLTEGDEIILTQLEHHANIVPWQMLAKKRGLVLRYLPIDENYQLKIDELPALINTRTKIFAFSHISNVLGVINPVREMTAIAKKHGVITIIDGAQGVAHLSVDVRDIGCDFYVFSAHKVFGPTAVGVVYGREEWLNRLPPVIGGGEMIERVGFFESTYKEAPMKFEAGTPSFNQIAAWSAAIDYAKTLDRKALLAHEQKLGERVVAFLSTRKGWKVFVPKDRTHWVGIVSSYHESVHPHDLAFVADAFSVAVRAGNHCAMPLLQLLKVPATMRVSPSIYNTEEDIVAFEKAMIKAEGMF